MSAARFQPGHAYRMTSHYDGDTNDHLYYCVKRTIKFATFEHRGQVKRVGLYLWDGVEVCRPWGTYSMAPVLRADRKADAS